MNKPTIPYSLQVALSIATRDEKHIHDVVGTIIAKLGSDVTEFIEKYDQSDMPFVIAAMQIVSNGLMPMLGEDGQGIVQNLVRNTQVVTMNGETFRQFIEQEEDK